MAELLESDGVVTILLSKEEAHRLAREMHSIDMYDSYDSVLYAIYNLLVPTEED